MATRNLTFKRSGEKEVVGIPIPDWVNQYDIFTETIALLRKSIQEITKLKSQRSVFKPEETDRKLNDEFITANNHFQHCENCVKEISRLKIAEKDKTIVHNAVKRMLSDLRDEHTRLYKQQKEFLKTLKPEEEPPGTHYEFTEQEQVLDNPRYNEIVKITQSVQELATLFKELNMMVIEQGTLVDRIDYNVEIALGHTVEANKELEKADDMQQKNSRTSCVCIVMLLAIIILLSGILIWKKQN